MSRRSLRHGAGVVILAAGVLLPQTAWGQGVQIPPPGSRGALSVLGDGWSDLWSFLAGTLSKNRAGIDPNGERAPSESTQTAPAPTTPDPGGDNRASIDPDG